MKNLVSILIVTLFSLHVFSANAASKANKSCKDMQVLLKAAQTTIDDAMASDENNSLSDYLVLDGDPELAKSNANGKDVWKVPVVVDGDGCYGSVDIKVKAGTCKIVGKPRFNGVLCTDN
jgi:hypothetical protein